MCSYLETPTPVSACGLGRGHPWDPQPLGVRDSKGDPEHEARLRICLFVGQSVGMKGGVAQGRVPGWGELRRGAPGRKGSCGRPHTEVGGPLGLARVVSEEVLVLARTSSPSCFCSGLAKAWSQRPGEESP